jgi:4-alpha-glucanotransferase
MKRRTSGILLHITSLPSPWGIGDLGPSAYRFADFLSEACQGFWQVLPLNPTRVHFGNSPYSSPSAFAGNPILIGLDPLVDQGVLSKSDLKDRPHFPDERVDYPAVTKYKETALDKARRNLRGDCALDHFCEENAHWLDDYALFIALKEANPSGDWSHWPVELRDRNNLDRLKERLKEPISREKAFQFLFFRQWSALKNYCHARGIQIIGDTPIYVVYDGADVWAHPDIFQLDAGKKPAAVAGVPPDYFSSTGQLWGNPLYDWKTLQEKGYSWWLERIAHNLKIFDILRLDHFKGFAEYWAVPAGESTAINGKWMKGPGADIFNVLLRHMPDLPLIAEDLGVITPDVEAMRDRFELPGMRVLQFAFGNDPLADEYKPFSYIRNCVAYTGTHDNDTLLSWILGDAGHSTRNSDEANRERAAAMKYIGAHPGMKDLHWEFIRLLMMTSANTVITPLQDVLGLGNEARMNRPGTARGNWEWRILPRQLTSRLSGRLAELTGTYGRA